MGEHPWDRTHLACTRSPDTGSTRDACAPRRALPMDQPRIFIGDTKTQRTMKKFSGIFRGHPGIIGVSRQGKRMLQTLKQHWPEYMMEAAELGIFMISACLFGMLFEHPNSTVRQAIPDPLVRRVLTGLAMGLTAISIVYSPWGKQSGAHFNPSMTLTFFRLGKVRGWDAAFYVLAQFCG